MRGLIKTMLLWHCFMINQIYGQQQISKRAFFIAQNNQEITYFKINLKPSDPDVRTFISLRERQVFMSVNPNSQALALLNDISFETTGDTIYKNIGQGVCINPQTPICKRLPRHNPGEWIVLFVADSIYQNQDWERAKSYFSQNSEKLPKERYEENNITIIWDIPLADTMNSLTIPVIFNSPSARIIEKNLINEEISRFKHKPEDSLIRKEVIKRYGRSRAEKLFSVRKEAGPYKLEETYRYRVVFRIW